MKMQLRKKMALKIVVAMVAFALVVNFVLPIEYFPSWALSEILVMANPVKRMKLRLLCKTDHQVLLEACRELSIQANRGNLKSKKYSVRMDPHPEVSQFPQPILDLAPNFVYIEEDGHVRLEMHGGMNHLGVEAYPEDFEKPYPSFKYGHRELIEGLWYYDDEYEIDPEYGKRIEALIQKGNKKTK